MTERPRVRFGMAVPQVFLNNGPVDTERIRRCATRAEELGYESLWVFDVIRREVSLLEPMELLSYVAAITSRVRLGTAILLVPLHHPAQLARAVANLDNLSQGRVIVGLGLGGPDADYVTPPSGWKERASRFVESLEIMKALWTQPTTTYEGSTWRITDFPMGPKPVQQPHPPIWFGVGDPNALRRTARLADGWIGAGSASTNRFRQQAQQLRQFLEEEGRDPASFPVSKRVYIAVDNDKEGALRRLQGWFDGVYHRPEMAERVAVWGGVEECVERVAEVIDAGAGHVVLNPVYDELEQLEVLAEEVIPEL